MKQVVVFFLLILCCSLSFSVNYRSDISQDKAKTADKQTGKQATGSAQPKQATTAQLSAEQIAALRNDIERMKVLVRQMETNLTFVDARQSPLRHQFELEIDMWKTLVHQMERELPPTPAE
ncbi:MAG TPA: hypothetical protein VKZ53_01095 [Candidatus Angelobacter sp.]|nr:hypothetical protein [Candidatus Angelobacter sp.]